MKLSPAVGPKIDIHKRFRNELRDQDLPERIYLVGNDMQKQVAKLLLEKHAPKITVSEDGEKVQLMSLEAFGSGFLSAFMESEKPPQGKMLLYTIPEEALLSYAEHYDIPLIKEEKSKVREFVERIAKEQPQTFFSLGRSAQRLKEAARDLQE